MEVVRCMHNVLSGKEIEENEVKEQGQRPEKEKLVTAPPHRCRTESIRLCACIVEPANQTGCIILRVDNLAD
jgi:hypothetical protein